MRKIAETLEAVYIYIYIYIVRFNKIRKNKHREKAMLFRRI